MGLPRLMLGKGLMLGEDLMLEEGPDAGAGTSDAGGGPDAGLRPDAGGGPDPGLGPDAGGKRLMLVGGVMMVGSLLPDVHRVVIINMRNVFSYFPDHLAMFFFSEA